MSGWVNVMEERSGVWGGGGGRKGDRGRASPRVVRVWEKGDNEEENVSA